MSIRTQRWAKRAGILGGAGVLTFFVWQAGENLLLVLGGIAVAGATGAMLLALLVAASDSGRPSSPYDRGPRPAEIFARDAWRVFAISIASALQLGRILGGLAIDTLALDLLPDDVRLLREGVENRYRGLRRSATLRRPRRSRTKDIQRLGPPGRH